MRRRRMGALHVGEPRVVSFQQVSKNNNGQQGHGAVVEEIHGLIRVYKDGHVERLPAIPDVPCTWGSTAVQGPGGVIARDVVVDRATGVWARLYAPAGSGNKVPVVVYFHGGGFCVGSAAWSCYHEFLAQLPLRSGCAVMSVDYRLAPEHRLPAAFDDGLAAVRWLRQQAASCRNSDDLSWWRSRCRFDSIFLMGDSAGATIAFHVAARLGQGQLIVATNPVRLGRGTGSRDAGRHFWRKLRRIYLGNRPRRPRSRTGSTDPGSGDASATRDPGFYGAARRSRPGLRQGSHPGPALLRRGSPHRVREDHGAAAAVGAEPLDLGQLLAHGAPRRRRPRPPLVQPAVVVVPGRATARRTAASPRPGVHRRGGHPPRPEPGALQGPAQGREERGAGHVRRRRTRLPGAPQLPPVPAADAGDARAHQGLRQREVQLTD